MMSKDTLDAKKSIKLTLMVLIIFSGFMLLMPTVIMASNQSSVTEISAPELKTNEYYIFTQDDSP